MTGGWGELLNRVNRLTGKMDSLIPPGSKCLFKQSLATRVGQVPIEQVSSRSVPEKTACLAQRFFQKKIQWNLILPRLLYSRVGDGILKRLSN